MIFSSFKILADENIDQSVVAYLKSKNLDVYSVKDSHLHGSPDSDILSFAVSQQRVILTHDTDFTTIVYTDRAAFLGIVFLQPGHIQPSYTIQSLTVLLEQDIQLKVPFIIILENKNELVKIRIRNSITIL
jgi:predicted nuclease of predicted toxin-antitoxin system